MQKKFSKNMHVLPHSEKGWAVKQAGNSKNSRLFVKQTDAISFAKDNAKSKKSELFIHGRDGRIRERNTYGKDPFPPKN